jgi:hypothetical protein
MSGGWSRPTGFKPDDGQRRLVEALRANGVAVATIAAILQIDPKTLRRAFKRELVNGKDQIVVRLGAVVVRSGLQGDWRAALAWLARHTEEWRNVEVVWSVASYALRPITACPMSAR